MSNLDSVEALTDSVRSRDQDRFQFVQGLNAQRSYYSDRGGSSFASLTPYELMISDQEQDAFRFNDSLSPYMAPFGYDKESTIVNVAISNGNAQNEDDFFRDRVSQRLELAASLLIGNPDYNNVVRMAMRRGRVTAQNEGHGKSWVYSTAVELVASRAVAIAIGTVEKAGQIIDYDGVKEEFTDPSPELSLKRTSLIGDIATIARSQILSELGEQNKTNRIHSSADYSVTNTAIAYILERMEATGVEIDEEELTNILGDAYRYVLHNDAEPEVLAHPTLKEFAEEKLEFEGDI